MDLIILIVIAVVLVLKLKSQLGNVDKEERDEEIIKRFLNKRNCCCSSATTFEKKQDIVEVKEVFPVNDPTKEGAKAETAPVEDYGLYVLDNAARELQEDLRQIAQMFQEVGFTAAGFISSSKKVYEMTIDSYANGDLENLQELVSPAVYTALAQKIQNRNQLKHSLHNSIIRIKEAKFYEANIDGNKAVLGVAFLSEQINFVENEQHEVIKGNKNDIVSLADYWLFEKQQGSAGKGWLVIDIADTVSPKIIQGVLHSMKLDNSSQLENSELNHSDSTTVKTDVEQTAAKTTKTKAIINSATHTNKVNPANSKQGNLATIKSRVAQKAAKAVSALTGNKKKTTTKKD